MTPDLPYQRTLPDLPVGRSFEHWLRKTVTESDHNLFCLLTLNHHPLHSDQEYAARQQHGRIVVNGLYVLSLVVGLTVPDLSGACVANLEYESVIHQAPVFIGDTLRARSKVLEVTSWKNRPDCGVVTVATEAFNQHGQLVLSLRRKILVPENLPPR